MPARVSPPPILVPPVRPVLLAVAAVASVTMWLLVEFVFLATPRDTLQLAEESALAMRQAHRVLWAEKERLGLLPADDSDPNRTGMIGPEYTIITTSVGSLPSKRTVGSPDFAAATLREMAELELAPGTPVLIVLSGSLVGANVATILAAEKLGLRPVVIGSAGASMWGATDPEFTWYDIERTLIRAGVIQTGSIVGVMGGTGGIGIELEDRGRAAIRAAAVRNGIRIVAEQSLGELAAHITGIIDGVLGPGVEPGLVVNVGGSVIGLGTCHESYDMPTGLTRTGVSCTDGTPGIGMIYAARGVPLLHILGIRDLASRWDIPFDPVPFPSRDERER